MSNTSEDYITLVPAISEFANRWRVVVRRYRKDTDTYTETQNSKSALTYKAAEAIAHAWSRALGLEVR